MLPRPQVIDHTLICWVWSIANSPCQKKGKREGVLQRRDSCPRLDSAWSWSKVRPFSHHGPNIPNSLPIHLSWWLKQLTSLCHFPWCFSSSPMLFEKHLLVNSWHLLHPVSQTWHCHQNPNSVDRSQKNVPGFWGTEEIPWSVHNVQCLSIYSMCFCSYPVWENLSSWLILYMSCGAIKTKLRKKK